MCIELTTDSIQQGFPPIYIDDLLPQNVGKAAQLQMKVKESPKPLRPPPPKLCAISEFSTAARAAHVCARWCMQSFVGSGLPIPR